MSTYNGMLARDTRQRRPFVLSRSFFMGSQKFGAFWTGDNTALGTEVQGSVDMLLANGVSGFGFGGADIPGFFGHPTDELFVRFYQVGAFYPFFRAHSTNEFQKREPWLQSTRV